MSLYTSTQTVIEVAETTPGLPFPGISCNRGELGCVFPIDPFVPVQTLVTRVPGDTASRRDLEKTCRLGLAGSDKDAASKNFVIPIEFENFRFYPCPAPGAVRASCKWPSSVRCPPGSWVLTPEARRHTRPRWQWVDDERTIWRWAWAPSLQQEGESHTCDARWRSHLSVSEGST